MKKQALNQDTGRFLSGPAPADLGKIVLGAFAGAVAGTGLGAVYSSLAMAIFGAMGGAMAGMVGAARYSQAPMG